jgi:hypothetical protein
MEIHEDPAEQGKRELRSMDARRRFRSVSLTVGLKESLETHEKPSDAEDAPRKRVPGATGESFVVVNKAPNGQAEPLFDRTREVWVTAWRKPMAKSADPPARPEPSPSPRGTDTSRRPLTRRRSEIWPKDSTPRRR